jgi:retinol-binding protein 3
VQKTFFGGTMSEKVYAWLLRLFPAGFREAYGKEALELFCDRWRDERGLFLRLRLWGDLLADLMVSIPREYRFARATLSGQPARPDFGAIPGFHVLAGDSIRPTALVLGTMLAAVALGVLTILSGHAGTRLGEVPSILSKRSADAKYSPIGWAAAAPREADIPDTPAGRVFRAWLQAFNSGDPSVMETYSKLFDPAGKMSRFVTPRFRTNTGGFEVLSAKSPEPAFIHFHVKEKNGPTEGLGSMRVNPTPTPTVAAFNMDEIPPGTVITEMKLDAAEQHRVIHGTIANLNEYYVYPKVAQQMADALLAHERNGDDNAETDGGIFAGMLTAQMQAVSRDKHLRVMYKPFKTQESASAGPTAEEIAHYREVIKRKNCSFEEVRILSHNIGYLKFNEFPAVDVCRSTVESVMKSLRHADAVIFDLRDNGGGDPHMVALMCSYLFDHRTHLNDIYDRHENTTQEFWTSSPIPDNTLADKPAYVLTSANTFSGAEEFSNDLKNLKRATLVGETTAGGAHLVQERRIDEHFSIGVPFGRPINPISKRIGRELALSQM